MDEIQIDIVENIIEVSVHISEGSSTDEKVKYNTDDTSAGFLADKIVAGAGISLSEGSGGDVDKLKITSTAVGTDEKVKYNTDDTAAGFLADKVVAGVGIALSEGTGGDADKLKITGHEAETAASIIALGIDELEFSLIKSYMI